jgi:hypothetical protein
MHKIKKLNAKDTGFTANGNRYYFSEDLPISRFREFQKLKILLQYGSKDEAGLFDDFKTIYNEVNGNELDRMKILEICHNNMHGIKHAADSKYHAVFQLAALFINRETEDTTKFDKGYNDMKIADWEAEGFAASDFFQLAVGLVKNFTATLQNGFQNSLTEKQTKEKPANIATSQKSSHQ